MTLEQLLAKGVAEPSRLAYRTFHVENLKLLESGLEPREKVIASLANCATLIARLAAYAQTMVEHDMVDKELVDHLIGTAAKGLPPEALKSELFNYNRSTLQ